MFQYDELVEHANDILEMHDAAAVPLEVVGVEDVLGLVHIVPFERQFLVDGLLVLEAQFAEVRVSQFWFKFLVDL